MKYLLDTYTLLWSVFDPDKLPDIITAEIASSNNEICISTISFWEISLKFSIGKLHLNNVTPEGLLDFAHKSDFEILNIDETLVSSFYKLPKYDHCDPFDRMLIWQAINHDLTIISKERMFENYQKDGLKTYWN